MVADQIATNDLQRRVDALEGKLAKLYETVNGLLNEVIVPTVHRVDGLADEVVLNRKPQARVYVFVFGDIT